ncbi:hypothetical protein [Phenylobacterium sp.]|nr:hypothetical protein [Phenylobacterium sp.]
MKRPNAFLLIAAAALAALLFGLGVDTRRDGKPEDVLIAAQKLPDLN